jgi:hypothetical protein
LVADSGASAAGVDPLLVNPWGLSAGPTTPWWTSNNGSNTSTLYSGSGAKQALTVAVAGGPTRVARLPDEREEINDGLRRCDRHWRP